MPRNCCVPGCKSNYYKYKPLVPIFLFPKDNDLREKWIRSIHRENFCPTGHSAVCIKHFSSDFIVREDKFPCADGSFISVPRKKIKLQEGAYTTLFENQPSYLSKQLPPKRKCPEERLARALARDEEKYQEWNEKDTISGFDNFLEHVMHRNIEPFIMVNKKDHVLLCKIKTEEIPQITASIKISSSLTVEVFHKNISLPSNNFEWCLGEELTCNKWSKFDCLLSHVAGFKDDDLTCEEKLSVGPIVQNEKLPKKGQSSKCNSRKSSTLKK